MPIVGDVKRVLGKLNRVVEETRPEPGEKWLAARGARKTQIRSWQEEHPLKPVFSETEIKPQHLKAEIDRLSGGQAIVTSDVGQHQMWAAQLVRFHEPRLWINSGGLGSMGFGLPSAIGAQFARPDKLVGNGGINRLSGFRGKDTLKGGGGADQIAGGGGSDLLVGGAGNDTCNGGKGKDTVRSCEKTIQVPRAV